jgi:hopanoid biosynthesis associated protein HpnK
VSDAAARLIVNADDFGLTEAINRGVVAAHRDGIVTAASLIACGPAFEQAVALAKQTPTLDVGVHLTLTQLAPVSAADAVPTLVDAHGRFAADSFELARRYVRGALALAEVRAELDAQINKVEAAGLAISHLDGHQHVHVLPGIAHVVADLAAAHGIRAARHPVEPLRAYMLGNARRLAEQVMLSTVCAVSPLKRLKRADGFAGFHFGGRLTEKNLATVLRGLPPRGTIELMCHPGEAESDGPHRDWGYAGPAEREALTSVRIKELLAERGTQLVSHRDLQ